MASLRVISHVHFTCCGILHKSVTGLELEVGWPVCRVNELDILQDCGFAFQGRLVSVKSVAFQEKKKDCFSFTFKMAIKSLTNGSKLFFLHFSSWRQWFVLYCVCLVNFHCVLKRKFLWVRQLFQALCHERRNVFASWVVFLGGSEVNLFWGCYRTVGKRKRSVWKLWSSLPCCCVVFFLSQMMPSVQ